MRILAIANHKGGCGKTATTRALGEVLANQGYKVLLVDLDPQGSLTVSCGVRGADPNLSDVIGGAQPGEVKLKKIIKPVSDNLDLAPSDLSMSVVALGLISRLGGDTVLSGILATVSSDYDLCLIDCPPSLSKLVINALTASETVLIPTQPLPIDVAGVSLFLDTVGLIRDRLNPKLSILGVLVTFYDNRLNTHKAGLEAMKKAGWKVLPVMIGRSVRVGESAGVGESITTFEPNNPQANAYKELGGLIEKWLKKTS